MSNVELTSLIFTIVSTVISTSLGIFAIWLSKHFDNRTSETLKDVKDLTSEIKNLTNTSINHQEKITSKMLEKLLNPSPYGIDNSSMNIEKGNDLEILVKTLLDTQNQKINELKEQITKTNQITSVGNDQTDLLLKLVKFDNYPAFYVLLNAIYHENSTNFLDLQKNQKEYGFPPSFRGGIRRLLDTEILTGTIKSFEINPKYHKFLGKWLNEQQEVIEEIGSTFNKYIDPENPKDELSQEEKEARGMELREVTKKLQFKYNETAIAVS
ncbi:hypothetical protein [Bacillus toyonensis]|uniref:hypothetical protein n=1 Tax=Bacillus toyonensis TaxID=155322 RepID=UPI00301A3DA1